MVRNVAAFLGAGDAKAGGLAAVMSTGLGMVPKCELSHALKLENTTGIHSIINNHTILRDYTKRQETSSIAI